ncbi:ATP-binding protein [Actinacidiphila glaucinigra]|uniref:ATP-binding protein n=1 Tax=Actinacidiphila glaucinigra TaxID=235986 RepID=UPI0035D5ACC8
MTATTPHVPPTVATFGQLLPHSRHGVRLARQAAVARLRSWPVPSAIADRAEQVVAELAANAALHGRVRGRSFRIALALADRWGTQRYPPSGKTVWAELRTRRSCREGE